MDVRVTTSYDNKGTQQARDDIGRLSGATRQAAQSQSSLTSAVAMGNAAYDAIRSSGEGFLQFIQSSSEEANRYQGAMTGLSSVSRVFTGETANAKQAAQDLASDGLMTVTEAATGLKNLLASGYSLPQAIQLMKAFKDSSAFGRQAALGFGEAVASATEGIKNGNSILVDNSGITKNLSVILEEAGYSQQDVMRATTDAGVRQALYNGILREAVAQQGDAARLADQYAGAQARAAAQNAKVKQSVGQLYQAMSGQLLSAYTNFMATNQQAVISYGAAAAAAVGFGGALFVAIKAIKAFQLASIVAAASNPLILALTALSLLAGAVVYKAVDKMQNKISAANKTGNEMANVVGRDVPAGMDKASKSAADLADKLADIDKQMVKTNRDFQEQLAEMVKSHQDKVTDLSSQLNQEYADFKKTQDRKQADFDRQQASERDSHQKRVDDLQRSLDNERALGIWANQQKLRDLQSQLDQENADFAASQAEKKLGYEQDVADAKQSHDSKILDLQTQLNQENALLNKHAADVAAVRNVVLLDEIDKLKRSNVEQLASLDEQRRQAIKSAQDTTAGVANTWNAANAGLNSQMSTMGGTMGTAMGNAFKDAIKDSFKDVGKGVVNFTGSVATFLAKGFDPRKSNQSLGQIWQESLQDPAWKWRAGGGPVTSGQPYVVGDNPDGSWNKTTELFVPNQSGQIMNQSQLRKMFGGGGTGGGVNITQTFYSTGPTEPALVRSAMEQASFELAMRAA